MTVRGKARDFATKRWLHRSGLISGVLGAGMLAAELAAASSEGPGCQPFMLKYEATDGGRIVLAACWSAAPVSGPVFLHYQLDLHLMISTGRVNEAAGAVR
jgi:hypothetical protein